MILESFSQHSLLFKQQQCRRLMQSSASSQASDAQDDAIPKKSAHISSVLYQETSRDCSVNLRKTQIILQASSVQLALIVCFCFLFFSWQMSVCISTTIGSGRRVFLCHSALFFSFAHYKFAKGIKGICYPSLVRHWQQLQLEKMHKVMA